MLKRLNKVKHVEPAVGWSEDDVHSFVTKCGASASGASASGARSMLLSCN